MSSAKSLRFYFDLLSPYSYLAFEPTLALCARAGAAFEPVAVDLARLKAAAGNTGPSTRQIPPKAKYARRDLARWAHRYGVPLTPPARNDASRVNRGFWFAPPSERVAYMRAVWKRSWGAGADSTEDAFLADVAKDMNWRAEDFLAAVASPQTAAALGEATEAAARADIFGVPSFVVGAEMWWGNDRLFFVEEFLAGAS